ncbi:hypothetical protein HPB50_024082 [Hyalomma asiaticum]|uniref:Uncharacterized protein n=1 Tax=Hyalomma asiaticum TaxID=266040 RepID=A0ACB7ST28_HYAAI|nr:hypothetical protein HPB50_024082 [Hyalomma asiaticum]
MYVWTAVDQGSLRLREPFVVDVCPSTVEHIDELLTWACEGTDVAWPPPPQEKECIATAALNLLRLQIQAALTNGVGAERLGLVPESRLLSSLKQRVVALASGANILPTVQRAAQQTLQAGWSFLLPTADERARALSLLLLSSTCCQGAESGSTPGKRFMTDLLVGSLMADGGLESSLQTAIKVEIQDIEDAMEKETMSDRQLSKEMTSSGEQLMSDQAVLESETKRSQVVSEDASAAIPLLHLVKQLLRNTAVQAMAKLQSFFPESASSGPQTTGCSLKLNLDQKERSPSLDLLLRFQRLLLCQLYPREEQASSSTSTVTGRTLKTVNRIVRAFKSCRRIKDAPRKPRSRVTTEREDAWIIAAAAVKPGLSAQQIKNTLDLRASVTTVKQRLREAGLKSRIAAQKPLLRAQNKEKRLQFSRQHAQRSTEEWKQVVFTDECTFTASCDQQARIWRPDNTRYQAKFLQRVSKSGRSTVNVWGMITKDGLGPLVRIDGKFTANKYCEILTTVAHRELVKILKPVELHHSFGSMLALLPPMLKMSSRSLQSSAHFHHTTLYLLLPSLSKNLQV